MLNLQSTNVRNFIKILINKKHNIKMNRKDVIAQITLKGRGILKMNGSLRRTPTSCSRSVSPQAPFPAADWFSPTVRGSSQTHAVLVLDVCAGDP